MSASAHDLLKVDHHLDTYVLLMVCFVNLVRTKDVFFIRNVCLCSCGQYGHTYHRCPKSYMG